MKKSYLLIVLLFFLVLLSSQVFAIRLSPGSVRFFYDEINGVREEFVFTVASISSEKVFVGVSLLEPLSQYVTVDLEDFSLNPGEQKLVHVKLDIPPGLDLVGVHDALIMFSKKAPSDAGEVMMAVTTALAARVVVTFSYPGEFIDIISLDEEVLINEGENAVINWEVQAKGLEITNFVNELVVKDREGVIVFSDITPSRALARNEVYSGKTNINSEGFSPGSYIISLKSSSRDNFVVRNSTLKVGEEDVRLVSFYPSNFSVGEILEFSFVIENLWNGEFKGVYGKLVFGNVSMVTKSFNLGPFAEVEVSNQFINLKDLKPGTHNGVLTIYFDEYYKSFDV